MYISYTALSMTVKNINTILKKNDDVEVHYPRDVPMGWQREQMP